MAKVIHTPASGPGPVAGSPRGKGKRERKPSFKQAASHSSPLAHRSNKRMSLLSNSPRKSLSGRSLKKRVHQSEGGEVLLEGLDGVLRREVATAAPTGEHEIVEDSQVPEGGPPLIIPEETYGAFADNEQEDDEEDDEESQAMQVGQPDVEVPVILPLFPSDDDLASFSHRIDVKNFIQMMGVISAWGNRMLERFGELRSEVDHLRGEIKDESAHSKMARMDRDEEHRLRTELEAKLVVAEQKLTNVTTALGLPSV